MEMGQKPSSADASVPREHPEELRDCVQPVHETVGGVCSLLTRSYTLNKVNIVQLLLLLRMGNRVRVRSILFSCVFFSFSTSRSFIIRAATLAQKNKR